MPQFLRVFPEVDPVTSPGAEFNKGYVPPLPLLLQCSFTSIGYAIDDFPRYLGLPPTHHRMKTA